MLGNAPLPETGDATESGCCCANCTPFQRKIGYYLTFLLGLFLFAIGIINLIGIFFAQTSAAIYLAGGGIIIILNPLWIKNCSQLVADMKKPVRFISSVIYVGCIIILIISDFIFKSTILTILFSIGTVISGIWYFLSYFEKGQEACIGCIKSCCCSKKTEGGEA